MAHEERRNPVDVPPLRDSYFAHYQNRKEQHTLGHVACPACAHVGQMLVVEQDFSRLAFRDAVPLWLELRRQRELRPTTNECTKFYLGQLGKFFGQIPMHEIRAGHLRAYQMARRENKIDEMGMIRRPWKRAAGPSLINHELNALAQMLQHCRLWAPIAPLYRPLSVAQWSPRTVPTEDEERRLFEAVKRCPEVALATWVATITNNTSAAGCELRGLRLKHVLLREPTIGAGGVDRTPSEVYIPREATKNDDRPRRIPLNTAAKFAFMHCVRRAHELGSVDPEHYLFPFRVKRNCYDPTRPASKWFLRNNWNKLREVAALPDLRPHDMRHLFITRLLEMPGTNPETVQALAGHVGRRMMEYYSHIRMDAKLEAVMSIDPARRKKPAGSVRPDRTAARNHASYGN